MLKKLLSVALAAIMVLGMSTSVFAAENRDVLTPIPPSSIGIQPDGAKPPSSSADIHNLSVSEYNYQVEDVGYRVYTSKWLTGASSMDVLVDNWTILESYGGTSNIVTVRVFNSSKKEVTSIHNLIPEATGSGIKLKLTER